MTRARYTGDATMRLQRAHTTGFGAKARRIARWLLCSCLLATPASAHDLERTQVSIVFSPDGSFVADVANDPFWLQLRLSEFPGSFADRVVFWVDGHEVRPTSVEFVPPSAGAARETALARYRLRGRMPLDARTLRWYYGIVIDPYPMTIRRADGRLIVEEVQGDAWSRTIDLSGQFSSRSAHSGVVSLAIAGLLLVPLALRFGPAIRRAR